MLPSLSVVNWPRLHLERILSCQFLSVCSAHISCCFLLWRALLIFRTGGCTRASLEVPFSHFQHMLFFGLVAVAFWVCFKFAILKVSWRSAYSKTSISDSLDCATCTCSVLATFFSYSRIVALELVFDLIWRYLFPACMACFRHFGFVASRCF